MSSTTLVNEPFDHFFASTQVRGTWIAIWTLWIIWALLLLVRYAFGSYSTPAGAIGGEAKEEKRQWAGSRLERAQRVARDTFLFLLAALVVNSFGRGSAAGVSALAWIYFSIVVAWILTELFVDSRIVRLLFALVTFPLIFVIFLLAYTSGWKFHTATV